MERDEPSRSPHGPCAIEVGAAGGCCSVSVPGVALVLASLTGKASVSFS